MSWLRIRAMARKEALHVLRDRRSLMLALALPLFMLLLFGYALTMDVDKVPLVVWDQSQTPASRELVSRFNGSRYFSLRRQVWNYRELERAFDSREALAAIVIPTDFAGRLESGRTVAVECIVDGTDANTATFALAYAEAISEAHTARVALHEVRHRGAAALPPPVEARERVWFNSDLESLNFILPGLIVVIMMVIAALLTSLTVAREWEQGTMEQLISTPVKSWELLLGKFVPYFAIGMFDVLVAVLLGKFLFHVPLRGSVWLLFAFSAIFLVGALYLGLTISTLARNQTLASQAAMLTTLLPSFLLSGFAFPIRNMPAVVQAVTLLIPARYLVTAIKGIYLKGVGLETLAVEMTLLTAFAVLMVLSANWLFRKRIA
jgi:ABC-2 type transport system permease protein